MRVLSRLLWTLILLAVLSPEAQSRSFPAASDVTEAEQMRWGTQQRGYVTQHCYHGTSASTTVSLAACRAYALDSSDPPRLVGFEETTPRTLIYSGGDGTYWLGGRWTPALEPPGWTCLPGTHYCWVKSATPPAAVSGLLVLGRSTVTSGAVTQFVIMAPWRRTTPYVVPAGTTLTFGACPEAGRWPLWDANETTTGTVRFTGAPCSLYPEWWGIDPTGTVDGTALWNVVIEAAATASAPLLCEGVYRISAPAGQYALTLREDLKLLGRYQNRPHTPSPTAYPCKFNFYGLGSALWMPAPPPESGILNNTGIVLENLHLEDMERTGKYGLRCTRCNGSQFRQLNIYSFEVGYQFDLAFFYGEALQLKARNSRKRCADWSANANHSVIDVQCAAQDITTLEVGVSVSYAGTEEPMHGTSRIPTLHIIAEVSSGLPVFLGRLHGVEAVIYIETPGECAAMNQQGLLHLVNVSGGSVNAFVSHVCTGTPLPVGIWTSAAGFAGADVKNLELKGWVSPTFQRPLKLDAGAGSWGIDLSGLAIGGNSNPAIGPYTTGVRLGNNTLTHGTIPLAANMGRDDRGDEDTRWKAGDVIIETHTPADGVPILTNQVYMLAQGGDVPKPVSLVWPTTTEAVGAAGNATPELKIDNIQATRIVLESGGVPVTNFINYIESQCLIVRVQVGGTRQIVHGTNIQLKTGASVTLNDTQLLHLCTNAGVWRETR